VFQRFFESDVVTEVQDDAEEEGVRPPEFQDPAKDPAPFVQNRRRLAAPDDAADVVARAWAQPLAAEPVGVEEGAAAPVALAGLLVEESRDDEGTLLAHAGLIAAAATGLLDRKAMLGRRGNGQPALSRQGLDDVARKWFTKPGVVPEVNARPQGHPGGAKRGRSKIEW